MSLKIPMMNYDKKLNQKEGEKLLKFIERYIETFQDDMAEQTFNKITSNRFFGYGAYQILKRRRENFSDDEVEDPNFFYIQKYKKIITKLIVSTENNFTNPYNLEMGKLNNLLDFFKDHGYLSKKQKGLVHFLLKSHPSINTGSIPPQVTAKIKNLLEHHIKKGFMKVDTAQEVAKMLTKELKEKEAIPKKKMFFSLSQIRNELSS